MDVCGQHGEPAGIAPASKRRHDFRCEHETQYASEDQRAVDGEHHVAISPQRREAGREQQHGNSQHNQQTTPPPRSITRLVTAVRQLLPSRTSSQARPPSPATLGKTWAKNTPTAAAAVM